MSKFNPREQSLIDALNTRLADADTLQAGAILKEIESSEEYQTPSHSDHNAYLHMIPLTVARQMELAGEDPRQNTNTASYSMQNNQRFTHGDGEKNKPLDFSKEDAEYKKTRDGLLKYKQDVEAGKVPPSDGLTQADLLEGAKETILDLDKKQEAITKARETGIARIEAQENKWEAEEAERRAQIKKDFMADRLKNSVPAEREELQKLADQEWSRLQSDYGF